MTAINLCWIGWVAKLDYEKLTDPDASKSRQHQELVPNFRVSVDTVVIFISRYHPDITVLNSCSVESVESVDFFF